MELAGRVALVTGAARRVGRSIAAELARAGCDLALHYNTSEEAARELADGFKDRRVLLVQGDLADIGTPARLVDEVMGRLGRLDILVNNASTFDRVELERTTPELWQRTFRVNALAPALLAQAAAPHMRTVGGGRIINLTDIMADRPPRRYAAYCMSKAALAGLTRCLAIELAPEITVNAIAPGIAEFPEHYDHETRERLVDRVPLKRAGTPEEVAALVRFLVTEGGYITGQVIPLDGGRSIRP
jgi:pteridine reductase